MLTKNIRRLYFVPDQKLADVGQGGPGTVFDTFEYTTEATPYGKPRISSGYGIVRGPGQLIYRTTNSPTDVNGKNKQVQGQIQLLLN